jgi:hypothetical protein
MGDRLRQCQRRCRPLLIGFHPERGRGHRTEGLGSEGAVSTRPFLVDLRRRSPSIPIEYELMRRRQILKTGMVLTSRYLRQVRPVNTLYYQLVTATWLNPRSGAGPPCVRGNGSGLQPRIRATGRSGDSDPSDRSSRSGAEVAVTFSRHTLHCRATHFPASPRLLMVVSGWVRVVFGEA